MRPSLASLSSSAAADALNACKPKTLRQRVKSALLGGEKGAGLPGFGEVVVKGRRIKVGSAGAGRGRGGSKTREKVDTKGKEPKEVKENPVARLKLLLVCHLSSQFVHLC